MSSHPPTALFYLPGLVHQFGNMLLTLQGQMLRVQTDPSSFEQSVGGLVDRGSTALSIMRILLGEVSPGSAEAGHMIGQLVDLGRVPAREHGVALELRGQPERVATWVRADTFVRCCCEALRVWVTSMPSGAAGVLTAELRRDGSSTAVRLAFEPATGTLPFPAPAGEIEQALRRQPWFADAAVDVRSADGGFDLLFHPGATSSAAEA